MTSTTRRRSSITGTVSSAGVLLWGGQENDTWWPQTRIYRSCSELGLKYGLINSKMPVVLMGDTRCTDGWYDQLASDPKTQMDNKKRDDKLIACRGLNGYTRT